VDGWISGGRFPRGVPAKAASFAPLIAEAQDLGPHPLTHLGNLRIAGSGPGRGSGAPGSRPGNDPFSYEWG